MDKMRLMETAEKIADMAAYRLGLNNGDVCINELLKDNGRVEIGFFVDPKIDSNANAHPVINAGELVRKVAEGDEDCSYAGELIAKGLAEARGKAPVTEGFNISRDIILSTCLPKVVSEEKNRERIEKMPHRKLCDLAETVYFSAPGIEGGYIQVNYSLLKAEGIEEEELFEAAHRNLDAACVIREMGEVVGNVLEIPEDPSQPRMYIVTNSSSIYGAAAIVSKKLLMEYRDKIGEFFIFPSSVHEVILLQKTEGGAGVGDLRELVRQVNMSAVSLEDYLSDNVYTVSEDGEMHIA